MPSRLLPLCPVALSISHSPLSKKSLRSTYGSSSVRSTIVPSYVQEPNFMEQFCLSKGKKVTSMVQEDL